MKILAKSFFIIIVSSLATLDVAANGNGMKETTTALSNFSVTLDGSVSHDKNGDIQSYVWKQISGTSVAINNANEAVANFTAPNINTKLDFQLTETNNDNVTSTKTISITIEKQLILGLLSNQVWQ
jgi:hypothetical protein